MIDGQVLIRSMTRCLGDHEAIRVINGCVRSLLDEVKVERAWLCCYTLLVCRRCLYKRMRWGYVFTRRDGRAIEVSFYMYYHRPDVV